MFILNKAWTIKELAPKVFNDTHSEYPPVMRQLFWNRGLKTKKEIEQFFTPNYDKDLHSPYLLKNIRRAVKRINSAIDKNERILIYGDYDVDGVCGATLLKQVFEKLGAAYVSVYIPHRQEEGYGLNIAAIEKFTEDGVHLIVTVDCGSTNIKEIKYAQDRGIDVIVTDHHQVFDDVNFILVNPHQKGDKYPFRDLSGTGVAFKVAQALIDVHSKKGGSGPPDGYEKWLLDLVALATVADVMPLTGENRTLVKYGLLVMAKTRRPGLRVLMKIAKVTPATLSSHTIGFILGPRINAAGRMGHANLAFDLLNAENEEAASILALQLDDKNRERQALVSDILKEVQSGDLGNAACIYEGRKHWPIGVLGIVAGRLADKYNKPSFIYQKKEAVLVGSARTPAGFNTVKILEGCDSFLQRFGGHEQAGGFTADIKHEVALGGALAESTLQFTSNTAKSEPYIEIDAEVKMQELIHELILALKKFEPYGEANSKPVFLLSGVRLANIRMVGAKRNHFKCDIVSDNVQFKAIGFNFTEAAVLKNGDDVDILFNLEEDNWNGNSEVSLKLIDIKKL